MRGLRAGLLPLALEGVTGAVSRGARLLGGAASDLLLLTRRLTVPDGRDGLVGLVLRCHVIS